MNNNPLDNDLSVAYELSQTLDSAEYYQLINEAEQPEIPTAPSGLEVTIDDPRAQHSLRKMRDHRKQLTIDLL